MKPKASATWIGDFRRGKGVVTTASGTLSQSQYFATGDGKGKGPNPYELIAAAHAACFSMTLAHEFAGTGFTPQRIATTVTVTLEPLSAGWTITGVQLDVLAEVPRLKQNDFIKAALGAKTHCTISRLLKANLAMYWAILSRSRKCSRKKGYDWNQLQQARNTEDAEIKKVSSKPETRCCAIATPQVQGEAAPPKRCRHVLQLRNTAEVRQRNR